jgi:AraC-like DNA-binding protein
MILEGLREKEIFTDALPFRIATNSTDNFEYPSHWHSAVELIYAPEDICLVNVNNTEYTLKKKDILIIAAGDIHDFKVKKSMGLRYFIQFDPNKLFGFSDSTLYKSYQYGTKMIEASTSPSVHNALEEQVIKIIDEYNNISFGSELFFNARLLDITLILCRDLLKNNNEINHSNKSFELSKLDKAFSYIEENYNTQISLLDVAKAVGFSEYHFSRIFKKVTEKNFHTYLNEFRIKKAEKLLFDELTIAEVAYASGFNSIVTFNRIFKQVKGCSPSDYIKKRV